MKLLDLKLKNFRQFYAEQTITFASGHKDRNVTVIHGYNGSGKTALLNAFVWGLYGTTTPDFEEPGKLVNERALCEAPTGSEVPVSVRLRFKARGDSYLLDRSAVARRADDTSVTESAGELSLWKEDPSGELECSDKDPQRVISQLLPEDLYPFFFFNGERVETLASRDAYDQVEEGVKMLLDVEIYERSVRHLRTTVSAELSRELKRYGTEEMQDAVDREDGLRLRISDKRDELHSFKKNEAALDAELERVEQVQAGLTAIQELVADRNALRGSLGDCEQKISQNTADIAAEFSKNGYLAFAEKAFAETERLVSEARSRGELPAAIKPQFVDDLLEAGNCICNRTLAKGSPEVDSLLQWRAKTGLAELEEQISRSGGLLTLLRSRRASYVEIVDRLQTRNASHYAERRRIQDRLDVLDEDIGDGSRSGSAPALEQKRRSLHRELVDVRADIKITEDQLELLEEDLAAVGREIDKLKTENEKAKLIQKQKNEVEKIAGVLEEIYMIQKQDVRQYLSNKIGEIWDDAAVKDYQASVNAEFRLELTKTVGGIEQPVYGASTGEKQVLALSFVGSLVRKAKENEESDLESGDQEFAAGGDYPLVMDSPFGSLEDDYRAKVAEWIPNLASQVIVMVSKTQWRNEVESRMRDRIGKEYVLELHTPKEDSYRTIEIGGVDHPYVVYTPDPCEQTIVKEVEND